MALRLPAPEAYPGKRASRDRQPGRAAGDLQEHGENYEEARDPQGYRRDGPSPETELKEDGRNGGIDPGHRGARAVAA
jgi:hypothetical protein